MRIEAQRASCRVGRAHRTVIGWVAPLPNLHVSRALPAWRVGRYLATLLLPAFLAASLIAVPSGSLLAAEGAGAEQKAPSAEVTKAVEQASSFMKTQKRKEAAEILDKVIPEVVASGDQALITRALVNHAWACLYLKRYEDVIRSTEECVRLCGDYERGQGSMAHAENFAALARMRLQRKEEALAAYRACFEKYRGKSLAQSPMLSCMSAWMSYGPQLTTVDEVLEVHRANVVNLFSGSYSTSAAMARYQKGLVQLLVKARRADEALGEAKLYYHVAPIDDKSSKQAVSYLSMAFKAQDGSIHRLNKFLNFQRFGPHGPDGDAGTDDDLKNPLDTVEIPCSPERVKLLTELMEQLPDDHKGHRIRGYAYLFLEKPKEAVAEFKLAYQLCPVEEKAVQQAVDDAAIGLKAYHGTVLAAQRFLEYQEYGASGPDGQAGTDDDIEDPLKDF